MLFIATLINLLLFVSCRTSVRQVSDPRRPFYNVAHMVNTVKELHHALEQGCNAIETDVTFASNGTAVSTYHGLPCDCFRFCDKSMRIADFLTYSREITTPGNKNYFKNFSLLILDLKTTKLHENVKYAAGASFASILNRFLFNNGSRSQLNVLISVDNVDDSQFINGFNDEIVKLRVSSSTINKRIGWEISFNDPLAVIEHMWFTIGAVKNIWWSDGITNCLSLFRDQRRLLAIIRRRDACNSARNPYCIRKVYQWTIDYKQQFRLALRRSVDGILTNEPGKLNEVLEESEFKNKFRLAQPDDDPWTVFK